MKNGGCWIFLSHSSKDILKVRQIRNEFERLGHNPLAFHLRCLNTDTEEGRIELDNLIKREIDNREWFVFCDSKSAEQSKYVKMEKDYIYSNNKKYIWHLDLSKPIEEIIQKIQDICLKLKVFISYARRDYDFVKPLVDTLIKKDFDVWTTEDLTAGTNWFSEIQTQIKKTTEYGFAIIVLSSTYANSVACQQELNSLIKNSSKFYVLKPLFVDIPTSLKFYTYPIIEFDDTTTIESLCDTIATRVLQDIKNDLF